jgi:septum formation protein
MLPAALQRDLVLASGSPRRATILDMLGLEYRTVVAPVDEDAVRDLGPEAHVRELARLKVDEARARGARGLLVGADTIVVVDAEILNKPATPEAALAMLRRLRGRWHDVHTGVALLDTRSAARAVGSERTAVFFHAWDDDALRRYVDSGECMDKAGAYAIQGLGALLVREIRGCYYNVMGFPIHTFVELLQHLRDGEGRHAG